MTQKSSYNDEEIRQCGQGTLFGPDVTRLPTDNMLMIDRVIDINETGGKYNRGVVVAELDIHPELWFFACHFPNDPVMPGCLGLDAMWQLVGFFLAWQGNRGRGRALGVREVRFGGQVLPTSRKVTYTIDIRRVISRSLVVGIADGCMAVDGQEIYTATALRVGFFGKEEIFENER